MNRESTTQLEKELKDLVPRDLSEAARQRIEARIADQADSVSPVWFRRAVVLAVAAAVIAAFAGVFLILRNVSKGEGKAPPLASPPIVAENTQHTDNMFRARAVDTVMVGGKDHGIVWIDENTPAHAYQYHLVDGVEWGDESGRQRYRMTRPRDEIVLVGLRTD